MDSFSSDIGKTVIKTMQQHNRPMHIDEIAFKMRSTPTKVNETMNRLKTAKLVLEKSDGSFALNKNTDDYDIDSLSQAW